ncbi:hypothetical protein CHX26_14805 [Porphyrobacter sp. HT-58-2]|uniref:hypothetical protein n=1 Tax=Porphyrobacter sp. HT-58-2 TaxID=2023229 RepID=UPI000CDCD90B|nr:hypothetical protein [Porphyrobacter sp. HT-58-2]AUX70598.1 hypothetical protein CHX26_14805 [Porphyrobacter sp. HT-58-2]
MSKSPREIAETRARNRFIVITAVRFGGVAMVMLGFAIVRGLIDLPYLAGVGLAVLGFVEFFVIPIVISRAWKAGDEKRR